MVAVGSQDGLVVASSTVNHDGGSSSAQVRSDKSSQQAFNPKLLSLSDLDHNLEHHIDIMGTLKIHLCPSHVGQVKKRSDSVRLYVLQNAFLQVNLTVPEVVDIENRITFTLPYRLTQACIAELQVIVNIDGQPVKKAVLCTLNINNHMTDRNLSLPSLNQQQQYTEQHQTVFLYNLETIYKPQINFCFEFKLI